MRNEISKPGSECTFPVHVTSVMHVTRCTLTPFSFGLEQVSGISGEAAAKRKSFVPPAAPLQFDPESTCLDHSSINRNDWPSSDFRLEIVSVMRYCSH